MRSSHEADEHERKRESSTVSTDMIEPKKPSPTKSEIGRKLFEENDDVEESYDSTHGEDASSLVTGITISTTPHNSERSTKSVRWSTIEFYNHERVLGDHPDVEHGPPLAIGWNKIDKDDWNIDEYEHGRPRRRQNSDLLVPPEVREQWLIESGYSRSEIKDSLLELAYIQESRRKSASRNIRWLSWENFTRKLVAGLRKKKPGKIIEVRRFSD